MSQIDGIQPVRLDAHVTQHSWHVFMMRYDAGAFGGMSRDEFIAALRAEGIPCSAGYLPLTQSGAVVGALSKMGAPAPRSCPIAERVCRDEAVWLTQNLLLGDREDMDDIIEAFAKIKAAKG